LVPVVFVRDPPHAFEDLGAPGLELDRGRERQAMARDAAALVLVAEPIAPRQQDELVIRDPVSGDGLLFLAKVIFAFRKLVQFQFAAEGELPPSQDYAKDAPAVWPRFSCIGQAVLSSP
jgi:hypothetical protein